ncbi:MAG: APC family permease, partial [Chloroflexota bacterium]|nr:APC family permease [Chloroflexota bacterium]
SGSVAGPTSPRGREEMSNTVATLERAEAPRLERNAVGLTEVLFQSITHMAPAVATALSIGAATTFAGGNTPLAVVFALIACLFTAYSMGQLARHLPSAGGMYTYVARGLGSFPGWLLAWAFLLAEPIVPPALFASFGLFGAALVTTLTGVTIEWLWIPLAILCGAIVWWLVYRGVAFSTRTGVILGIIEIAVFLVVSALLVVNAGGRNTLSVFVPGQQGLLPALQGMVFCLLAFVGFEAAAPLGEEARDPRRTVPQAVILSAILIGLFYTFNYYAASVFFGPDRMTEFLTFNNGDPWGGIAQQVLPGIGSLLITFAILNSSLANANSGAVASTRAIFNLGRSRLIPSWFAAVHPTHSTPVNAVHFQGIVGIVIAVVLGLAVGGPLNAYVFIGYMLGLLFAGMYIAVNLAAIGFYLRERRDEFNPLRHVVVPILGVIAMIPAFLSVIGGLTIPILNITVPPLAGPIVFVPPLVGIWMVIGIVLYFVLRARSAERIRRVGEIVAEV